MEESGVHSQRTEPRRVLLIAFHFPPANASGTLRSLKFARYLPDFGWNASVLTVVPTCYDSLDADLVGQIPRQVRVHRTLCTDSQRAFSVYGRYPAFTRVPDRYVSWLPFGVARGLRVVQTERVDALLSTSPVPTAHLIAYVLKRLTGLPWVADFRDPWDSREPRGRLRRRVERWMEARVVGRADRIVGTTPEFVEDLRDRFGRSAHQKGVVIYNGYDDVDFAESDRVTTANAPQFTITHAGLLYPRLRNPSALLRAVSNGLQRGTLPAATRIRLLGCGPLATAPWFRQLLVDLGLQARVEVEERVPYGDALHAMRNSSVLLLLQGGQETRTQIPNKAFEYLHIGRPILCLATANSATARVMREFDGVFLGEPDDVDSIGRALEAASAAWRRGQHLFDRKANGLARYSRPEAARQLAGVLNQLVPHPHPVGAPAAATDTSRHETADTAQAS